MDIPFKLISADSHVVEPPDLWTQRIDRAYLDRAPKIIREDETDVFVCPGAAIEKMGIGFTSAALKPAEEISVNERWENIYPGAWDPSERLKDMEADGIEAEVLYTSFGLRMFTLTDPGFQLACFQAFNDWMADFCRTYPTRLFGVGMIPIRPADEASREMRRIKERGLRAAMISVLPDQEAGYADPIYDGIWSTAEELDLPISLHLAGTKSSFALTSNSLVNFSLGFTPAMYSVATMIFSGLFDRHPKLQVATVENDAGWAAIMMERMDFRYDRDRFWAAQSNGITSGRRPSQQFREHVHCSFMRDHTAVRNREYIGLGNIMWSSDFPHQDSSFPNSVKSVTEHFEGVPLEDQRKIARENAVEFYKLSLD